MMGAQGVQFFKTRFRPYCDWIDNHTRFKSFYLPDFLGLFFNREITVNNANSACLRHCNGEASLGNRIHSGTDERHIDHDLPRKPRL